MPETTDIAIIGAGIFGLSAAWAALQRGYSVTIHEAATPGAGASGGLIGALSPHMPEKWNPKKAFQLDALLDAERFWSEIAAISGLPTGYGRIGRLLPLHDEKARDLAALRAQEAPALWQGKAAWRITETPPSLAPTAFGCVHETLTARIFPPHAIAALAAAVQRKGARVRGAATPETAAGRTVILAAGHQIADLCPDLAPNLAPGLLRGVKGQSALLGIDLAPGTPVLYDKGTYIVPQPTGTAIGSTSENDWTDTAPDAALDPVIATARSLMPALADAPVLQRWSGIRPRARLPDPALGQLRDGLWLMTGGFKVGLGFGPKLGTAIIAMIAGEDPGLPDSFHLSAHLDRL